MIATLRKIRFAPALLALALAGASCAEPGVDTPLEPGAAAFSESTSGNLKLVRTHAVRSDSMEVSRWIDNPGGTLHLAGHQLAISAGTVKEPTLFVMRIVNNGYIQVDLRAYRPDPLTGELVDVGAQGFNRKVNLKLNYATAVDELNPNKAKIVHLVDDDPNGRLAPLRTKPDSQGKWLNALLEHFSMYAIAIG